MAMPVPMLLAVAALTSEAVSLTLYVHGALRGATRPHLFSQLAWLLLGLIALSAQLAVGFSWSAVLPFAVVVANVVIVALCLLGYGYARIQPLDYFCFVLALCSIGLWYATHEPMYALGLSIFALVCAGIPTYTKTYREPDSENRAAWAMLLLSSVLAFFASADWSFGNLAFVMYALLESMLVISLTFRVSRRP